MSNYSFSVVEVPTINLKVNCEVIVTYGMASVVEVEVSGTDSDEVKVSQKGNQINIFAENSSNAGNMSIISSGGSTYISSIGGGVVIGGSSGGINISGVSGRVVINGQEIDLNKSSDGKNIEPLKIKIKAPLSDLDINQKGHCRINAQNAQMRNTFAIIQGGGDLSLFTKSLDLSISGSCDARVAGMDGDLSVSLSGSSDVNVSGKFSNVSIQISGSGDIVTNGPCSGNYKAQVSGSGDVHHSGTVLGKVRTSVSGSGHIRGLEN